jgi:hypothetical protein
MTGRPSEATIWDVPAPVRPATPLRLPRASANAEELRWRGQAVTAPIERLVRAAANTVHDEDRYDLRRLAHRAIDLAVASMGFARELTDDELLEALAAFASRMAPEVSADEHRAVAAFVRKTLLNEQGDFAKFAFTGFDEEGGRHPFAFHLLTLRDAGEDTVVRASPEAINVFLRALDLDVTDAEAAVGVMLERQLADGRFEAAETSAVAASRASVAYAATLGNLLEDTRRDVTALDWRGSVRDEIETARRHVASRILEDDRLTEHVREGIEAPEEHVRGSAGRIAGILRECKEIHLDLEGRLVGANQAFLDAQREQQLARRTRLRLLSIERELLGPVLALPRAAATEITTLFAEEVLGLVAPRRIPLATFIEDLLEPARITSGREPEPEEPEVDEELADPQRYDDAALAAAARIFEGARVAPRRLSALVRDAAAVDPEIALETVELVWLVGLFAFAPEATDDDADPGITRVLTDGLAALDDGTELDDSGFAGADLLVGATLAIEALEDQRNADPALALDAPPVDDVVIPLERFRKARR